jgi:hypothetical protein
MKLAALGALSIEVTPTQDKEIMHVDIGCETRKETMSMTTNKDETVDQFCLRMKSMLRALLNAEPRVLKEEKVTSADHKPNTNWAEQKAEMKSKQQTQPQAAPPQAPVRA